ncbi:uncharacterized protein LOC114274748 [Camellia sinensis]|uniref:uncharacterized protein LOC114274748 n=1 Tax=Camellia sinensis TaxID=4442 RepID=UPI0010361FA6|nr:uncharacterized protein LOC114274748 [Camellia sinensis]
MVNDVARSRVETLGRLSVGCFVNSAAISEDSADRFCLLGSIFESRDELIRWARDVGRRNGYVIEMIFESRDELIRWARDVGRRNGYVIAVEKSDAGDTNDDWTLTVICGVHNHPNAVCLEGHSYAGRLSFKETYLLVDMSKSMLLLGQLAVNKYIEWHRNCKDTETVTDLFFAHPVSLDLLRAFPRVLLMDCTYKTNRYCLPLLEIAGVTSTEKTLCGFCIPPL